MKENIRIRIESLQKKLAYSFENKQYLSNALTHTSYSNEKKMEKNSSYERIEFLGDSILNLVISEYLFTNFLHLPEGELTRNRSKIVCEPTLAKCARKIGIGPFMLLGKGETNSGGVDRESILADVFEAIIGAIYLDSGYAAAKDFVLRNMEASILESIEGQVLLDYKTLLQELVQKTEDKVLYEIIEETGPDHDKLFVSQVLIGESICGRGSGRTKKEAEQKAAKEAYEKLNK